MNRKETLRLISRLALVLLAFGASSGESEAQLEVASDQTYLLLATTRTGTMEEELDEAAALGFRVVTAAANPNEMVLFLERVAEPPDTYDYRLLATTRTSTFQEELDAAAAEGFRVLSRTPICKDGIREQIVAILERAPGDVRRYEYELLATSRTSTLQEEVSDAVATGFALSAIVSCDEEHVALMERQAP